MKVSVVILAYNHESYIADAIESALMQQTDFPFEIVVGEDCSSDRTREIVVDFQKKYPDKITAVLHDQNKGPRANYREVFSRTTGKYIANLDGDDYWTSPDKLQLQADYLDSHEDASMCSHAVKKVDVGGSYKIIPGRKKRGIYKLEELLLGNPIAACSHMYRRELIVRYINETAELSNISGDWMGAVWNSQYGYIGHIDKVMSVYRKNESSIFRSVGVVGRLEWNLRSSEAINKMLDFQYDKISRAGQARIYSNMASVYAMDGDREKGKECLKKALKLSRSTKFLLSRDFFAAVVRLYLPFVETFLRSVRRRFSGNIGEEKSI